MSTSSDAKCGIGHPGKSNHRPEVSRAFGQGHRTASAVQGIEVGPKERQAAYRELWRHELDSGLVNAIRKATTATVSPLQSDSSGTLQRRWDVA